MSTARAWILKVPVYIVTTRLHRKAADIIARPPMLGVPVFSDVTAAPHP